METLGFVAEQSGVSIDKTNQLMDDAKKDEVDDQESALLQVIRRLEPHVAFVVVHTMDVAGAWADIEMSMVRGALKSIGGKANSQKFLELARSGYGQDIMRMLEKDPTLIMTLSYPHELTALHLAARSGNEDTVKLLVRFILKESKKKLKLSQRSEMSVFQKNKHGDTPLHDAVENGHLEVAAYLISKNPKASYYYFNNHGYSPLGLAVLHSHTGIVQEVFNVLSVTEVSSEMRHSALHVNGSSLVNHVLSKRNIAMLQLLLKNVPDLMDSKDRKGQKPLSYAACKGYLEEVSYLLTKYPNYANICDEDGTFPLHNAVKSGHLKVVAEFLTRCPQTIYQTNQELQTILHIAVRYSRVQVLTYMKNESLQKQVGQIFNSRDINGATFKELAILMFPDKS